jgi:hypothetical protein
MGAAEWGLGAPAIGSGQRRWPVACRWGEANDGGAMEEEATRGDGMSA